MKTGEALQTQTSLTAPSLNAFAEQGAVYDGLLKTLREGTTVHAYLISGMPGVGKRTLAGLIAQHLLCTAEDKHCASCPSCLQVQEGIHPDVIIVQPGVPINPEVDKNLKSIPVDEIRKVNELVNQHTFTGGRRIVMIRHAEKMTPQAQNALLKTLEEPVEGTVFLLMTDNPAALLPTIISRVRSLKLHPWPDETVRRVLRQRGITDEMRVSQAAQVSGGSIGRAIAVASDEEYWQRRQDVMRDFLGITGRSDILRVSTAWKDKKDEAGDLLSDLDEMLHLLLLVRLGQADPDMISQYPGAWQQMARKAELSAFVSLMDAVRDARRLRLSQVTWQAVIERLLLRLMEESSKWST